MLMLTVAAFAYSDSFLNLKGLWSSFMLWLSGITDYLDLIPMPAYGTLVLVLVALQIVRRTVSKVFTVIGVIIIIYIVNRYLNGSALVTSLIQ